MSGGVCQVPLYITLSDEIGKGGGGNGFSISEAVASTCSSLMSLTGNHIYVVVGCWEVSGEGSFANTALLFDRSGKIVGKYRKVHAAVDHYEGQPPWSQPPKRKGADWFIQNDPKWIMQRGDAFPVFDPVSFPGA